MGGPPIFDRHPASERHAHQYEVLFPMYTCTASEEHFCCKPTYDYRDGVQLADIAQPGTSPFHTYDERTNGIYISSVPPSSCFLMIHSAHPTYRSTVKHHLENSPFPFYEPVVFCFYSPTPPTHPQLCCHSQETNPTQPVSSTTTITSTTITVTRQTYFAHGSKSTHPFWFLFLVPFDQQLVLED